MKTRTPVPVNRKVTLPDPRCPLCHARMEECQLTVLPPPQGLPGPGQWQETWSCDHCHSFHTFPARLEVLQMAADSVLMPRSGRTLYLPR